MFFHECWEEVKAAAQHCDISKSYVENYANTLQYAAKPAEPLNPDLNIMCASWMSCVSLETERRLLRPTVLFCAITLPQVVHILSSRQSMGSLLPRVLLHKTTLSHMRLAQHSKGWLQPGLVQEHHPFHRQTAMERRDLSCTDLAHHELESRFVIIIMIVISMIIYYHHPFQCICAFRLPGQSKGCLLESLTASNCWLEVLIKRRGQEAAWERLHEAQVPDDLLAAFVLETHQAKAIPIPGESHSDTNPCIIDMQQG